MATNRLEHYKSINPAEAKAEQEKLRQKILIQELPESPTMVAGADISFNRGSDEIYAAIVIVKLPELKVVGKSLVKDQTSFPYIPGLLAFREMPVLLKAWQQIPQKPDVLILDGHGLAHPRRMGIATHFGIEVNHPTIGCAKNVLTGNHGNLGNEKGNYTELMDQSEKVGLVLRSRTNVNPVYISPGHRVSFADTYDVVMSVLTQYKLPRTTRLAHKWANKVRKGEVKAGYYEY